MMGKETVKRSCAKKNNMDPPAKKRQPISSVIKNERIVTEVRTGKTPNWITVIKTEQTSLEATTRSIPVQQSPMMYLRKRKRSSLDENDMNTKAAEKIFLESFKIIPKNKWELEAIAGLCEQLNGELLAIKHAAAYIKNELQTDPDVKKAIVSYLAEIETEGRSQNAVYYLKNENIVDIPIFLTTGVTLMKLNAVGEIGKIALKIMEVMSFLSKIDIDPQFAWYLYQTIENQELSDVDYNVFRLLASYSMIDVDFDRFFSVHELVQKITRLDLATKGKINAMGRKIMIAIQEMEADYHPLQLMKHCNAAWELASGIEELNEESKNFSLWIVNTFITAGKYKEVYDLSCRALNIHKSVLKEENKWSLKMKFFKASALEGLEENKKSLDLLIKVHKKQKKICKDDKSDLLTTASHIGLAYLKLNEFESALLWFNNILKKRQRINEDDQEILVLKNNIALVFENQKKFKEAEKLYNEVLAVQVQKLGIEDEATLATKQNLACLRFYMKEYKEALRIFQEVWETELRVLDANHPYLLTTKAWIVVVLAKLRRFKEAKILAEEVYMARVTILGRSHPDTIVSEMSLKDLESFCRRRGK